MLVTGSVLQARYRIERVLGHGGMGAVYLATEEHLGGKRVAIKEMSVQIDDPTERASATQQFEREARILATLDHPGLVDVSHYFEENGKQYLVMAFVDGKTLEQVLNEAKTFLAESQVVEWLDQVCDVLEYLHGQDPPIIFRDMKPSNVMLDARGRCRLIDFGIARSFDSTTKTATFIKGAGTAGFAPMEQYGKKGTTDLRSDIYALGATTYTLLTRTIPPAAVDMALNDEKLTPPSKINPKISAALGAWIVNMMAIKKEDRYQTMAAARQALRLAFPPSGDTLSFRRPRFCLSCGTVAPNSAVNCPRCNSALEEAKLMDVDTVPGVVKSESTALRNNSPSPNLQPKVMETSQTEPRLVPGITPTEPRLVVPERTAPEPTLPAPTPPPPMAESALPERAPPAPPPPVAVSNTITQHSRRTTVVIIVGLIGVALILFSLSKLSSQPAEPSPTPTVSMSVATPASPSPSPSLASPSPSASVQASMEPTSSTPAASGSPETSGSPLASASPAATMEGSASPEPSMEGSASPASSTTPASSGSPADSGSP
ncbi:MAG TPA: protein kinase [Candidatus Xenobia bacterium]